MIIVYNSVHLLNNVLHCINCLCEYIKFTLTQNITVTGHYLSLCSVSLDLAFVLSVEGLFTFDSRCGGPLSTVGFACVLESLSAMWVAVADPGMVLYCLFFQKFKV